jgi:hypothetical protein
MTFDELLEKKKDAILQRWLDDALAMYSRDAAVVFGRQKDPFANPVGHTLRVGTEGVFEALLDGMAEEELRGRLQGMIQVRAVQQVSASEAVSFVFGLKRAVRAELRGKPGDSQFAIELAKFDERVDRLALTAFDIYVECRQQVSELRINEVKRRVSWVLDKMGRRSPEAELIQLEPE